VKDNQIETAGKKIHKFDENDKLWMKFKNKHIGDVFTQMHEDFKQFMDSDIGRIQRNQEMQPDFDQMSKILHRIKGYQTQAAQFKVHLDIAEEMNNKLKQNNLIELIELEQDMVTGVNSKGEKVSNKDITNMMTLMNEKISEQDKIRLLLTLYSTLDVEEKGFVKVAKSIGISPEQLRAVKGMKWLGVDFGASKAKRPEKLNKEQIKELKTRTKTITYNFCRSSPKLESVVMQCSMYQLNKNEFLWMEEPKELPKQQSKGLALSAEKYGVERSHEILPYLIVFVIGGIAHNEISALEKLHQERKLQHDLILGSTSIINANDFIEQLNRLPQPEESRFELKVL